MYKGQRSRGGVAGKVESATDLRKATLPVLGSRGRPGRWGSPGRGQTPGASRRTLGPAYEDSYTGGPLAAPPLLSQGLLSPCITGGSDLVPACQEVTTGVGAGP